MRNGLGSDRLKIRPIDGSSTLEEDGEIEFRPPFKCFNCEGDAWPEVQMWPLLTPSLLSDLGGGARRSL